MISRLSEAVAAALLFAGWAFAALTIPRLPATVATHFARNGMPDNTGPSSLLWLAPAIGLVVYIIQSFVQRAAEPRINLPVTITDRNRALVYALAREMQSVLKTGVMLTILGVEWGGIDSAARNMLSPYFLLAVYAPIALVAGIVIAYTLRMRAA